MMSVLSASNLHTLRPHSRGITFAVRPPSATNRTLSRSSHSSTVKSSSTSSVLSAPDPTLTLYDIEQILFEKAGEKEDELRSAFKTLDADENFTVTRGEFQRVVDTFLLPLTQAQFDAFLSKIPVNRNGTIPYLSFLETYCPAGRNVRSANTVKRSWSSANQYMTLNQVECKLKTKISANLKNVVRSFRLFDYNQNGHLQRHELRRILENYCFKIKEAEFEKLWSRYCVGNKNTMDYKYLLKNLGINVDMNKRPIQETVEQVLNWEATQQELQKQQMWRPPSSTAELSMEDYTIDDIVKAFRKKVCVNHRNLVKAFKAFDATRYGFISLDAFKSVIDSFIFPLPYGTFKDLMNRVGFETNGKVAWERFLEKFQDPTGFENGQKTGQYNGTNPVSAKEHDFSNDHILRKFQKHMHEAYPSLRKAFLVLDDSKSGKVTRKEFRRILDCTVFRITDGEFKELMIILDPEHTGFLSYHQFLQLFEEHESLMGRTHLQETSPVKKKPVVLAWHTAEDTLCNKTTENLKEFRKAVLSFDSKGKGVISKKTLRRIILAYCPSLSEDHFNKRKEAVPHNAASFRKVNMDAGIRSLKDSLARQKIPVGNILLAFIKQPNGLMSKTDFRKVLEDNQMSIDDAQFNALVENLGFTNEGLSYLDFASLLQDPHEIGPEVPSRPGSNHYVNNNHVHHTTAEECLSKLIEKLRRSSKETYSIFRKADSNGDGIVTMHDLRRLLESFVLVITEKEFLRLLEMLGLDMGSTLSYKDFLELFQLQGKMKETFQQLSSHSPQCKLDDVDLVCEQAHDYLVVKAKSRWHDLAKNFREIDNKGNAIVQKKDVRNLFYTFALPIAPNEFEKLWTRYDAGGKGYLTLEEFLQKLGMDSSSTSRAYSRNTMEDNAIGLMEHDSQKKLSQRELGEEQKQKTGDQDIKMIEQYTNLGLEGEDRYFSFLEMVTENKEFTYDQQLPTSLSENFQMLSPQKALYKIKESITSSHEALYKAFSAFDQESKGTVSPEDFLHVIESFCFKLTEKQQKYIFTKLAFNENHEVYWKTFLNNFNLLNSQAPTDWHERVAKLIQPKYPSELTIKDIMTRIEEVVTGRFYTIAQEFLNTDYAKINVISKEDFREICNRNFMLLTDDQFENLWNVLPVNAYGNLKYHEFLKKYSREAIKIRPSSSRGQEHFCKSASPARSATRSSSLQRRPKTAPCILRHSQTSDTMQRPRTTVPCSTPLLNCEPIEVKLRKNLHRTWQDILKMCKEKDSESLGEITVSDFLAIGERFSMDLTKEEYDQLIVKYDIKNNGKFSYPEFLRNCVLVPKQKENTLLQRTKLQKARIPMSAGLDGPLYVVEPMLRIQPKILQCWKPMRRSFVSFDSGTGYISTEDFKKVLRQYSINLSEDEFFHILGYYDKDLTLKIPYNDFLRSFIR
ncbi:EF-hand calcium-binding domain-containing protein 6 isoform X2 [Lissotriton helveticus]